MSSLTIPPWMTGEISYSPGVSKRSLESSRKLVSLAVMSPRDRRGKTTAEEQNRKYLMEQIRGMGSEF